MLLAFVSLAQVEKVALFIIVLSILIVLHEYGHFIVARLNGVRVLEFAVGMGPKLISHRSKRSGTLYSLRALPIGGFCQMQGEDNKTEENEQQLAFRQSGVPDEENFQSKTTWQRLAVVVAGPFANFVLCLLILLAGGVLFGIQTDRAAAVVGPVLHGMPADKAGIRAGDRVVAFNGTPVKGGDSLVDSIHRSRGKHITLKYVREGVSSTANLTPIACPAKPSNGCIGFQPINVYERVPFGEAVSASFVQFANIAVQTVGGLALILSHPVQYAGQVSGVVGMGQAAGVIQDFGWGYYFNFAAVISFALGLFNLLPIPALDGGRLAFIVAEMVRGKPVDPEKEAMVHIAGFGVLLALMLVINVFNAIKIVEGKGPF
ncbi:MAG: site-2 protease family protein [Candidatus Eremiobacteraeota bacterium]|nr:site-2 protease family protein [Candidatus Eremiobacteraeota bacterium]